MQENQSGGTKFIYHPELIALYNSSVLTSVLVGNVVIGSIFVYILYPYLPIEIILLWIGFSTLVSLFRLILKNKFASYPTDVSLANKYIKIITLSAILNGTVWGTAALSTYLYAPSEYLFLSALIIISIVSGAMSSLSPIFSVYLAYTFFAITPLTIVLFLNDVTIYKASALLSIFLILFILANGFKHQKKLREAIDMKNELKLLNEDLEGEVKKRIIELEVLNNSLEDKVQDEISKNRDKDQQLLVQSRMAQMGEMISMIAHQWRQPLSAIAAASIDLKMKIIFTSFNLDDKQGQEECTTYFNEQLNNIEEYVQSLTNTIDDFRNFYKPNKAQKIVNVNEPIKKSLSIIQAAAKANGVDIQTDLKSQKEFAIYDSELMQVFLNIIKNSQDNFLEKKIQNGKVILQTYDTPKGANVEISDNGGGIPEAIMLKIFDPYFSTKDEKNGTGLGLYMSKTIIEEHHHGKLRVENKDKGVNFIIELNENVDE